MSLCLWTDMKEKCKENPSATACHGIAMQWQCKFNAFSYTSWGGGGGGGGMSHWGLLQLYIIRVNHFLKSTLNEDEATVPTLSEQYVHSACAPGYRSQISHPFRGLSADLSGVRGNCESTLFSNFPVFDTLLPLTRYTCVTSQVAKKIPFFHVFLRMWCTGHNETKSACQLPLQNCINISLWCLNSYPTVLLNACFQCKLLQGALPCNRFTLIFKGQQ